MKHLAILISLFSALPSHAAEQRAVAPAMTVPSAETNLPAVQVAPTSTNLPAVQAPGAAVAPLPPAGVSRQPAGAPASPLQSAPRLPVARTPISATPSGAMPSTSGMPAILAPQQPAAIVPGPLAPRAPSTPLPPDLVSPLSDYAIGTGTQASEGKWIFSIRNAGLAEPKFKPGSKQYASVSFAVGKPCATTGEWSEYPGQHPLPTLAPGGQANVSFSMEKAHINNGCKIKAELNGAPVNDINATNNSSITHTKAVLLPDLIVTNRAEQGSAKWPAGASIVIKNIGNAPAGPSTFHFYCVSKEPGVSCGTWEEKLKSAIDRNMPVPALKPGDTFSVMKPVSGLLPGTSMKVSWTGEIDSKKEIAESNEQNNLDALNQGLYFW